MALSADLQGILDRIDGVALEPTEEEITFFVAIKERIPTIRKAAQRNIRAGIDLSEPLKQLDEAEKRIDKVLREFKP